MTYISPPKKFLIIFCCKHIELQVGFFWFGFYFLLFVYLFWPFLIIPIVTFYTVALFFSSVPLNIVGSGSEGPGSVRSARKSRRE